MQSLTLGLEWFKNPDHTPIFIAQEMGWFAEAGIDLTLVEPKEHLDAIEEIAQDRMDIAITEPIHLVEDVAKGHQAVGFARFLHTNGGVMYKKGVGIERPRDMVGKRVQYPGAPGPGGFAIVRSMIEADGGPRQAALQPINNSFYHTDALLEDKADVATLVFYNFELIEAAHRGLDAGMFALKDWGLPDFCQLIMITSPEKLAEKKDLFHKFLAILMRGMDFIHQHPQKAYEIYLKSMGITEASKIDEAIFEATVPCFTYDLMMSHDYYRHLQDWMSTYKLIEHTQPATSFWTNELLPLGSG
ncbi:MAG: ABC transporter substrate-binding protein [Bacteroidota bacterium]